MTDDLVKRLREDAPRWARDEKWMLAKQLEAAADRIEQLQAEVKRLEQQLKMARRLAYRPQPEYPPEIGAPHLKED